MKARFGVFELDEEAGELRRAGSPVSIQPKPFALLALLIRERDRVVPMGELFQALWPDTVVSPGSLNRAVSHARRAIDDTGRGERIKSIARRGYRFMGDVVVRGESTQPDAPEAGAARKPRAEEMPAPTAGANAALEHQFVGRGVPLHQLEQGLSRVVAGESALYVVTGKAGIGKTRLTEIFAQRAYERGAFVVVSRCRDRDGVPPFWMWTQALQQLRAGRYFEEELDELDETFDLSELFPDLGRQGPRRKAPSDLPAEQQRFLFFQAATRTLSACARRHPLLLVLEDLQWAGSASLRLLEHIACELEDAPVMIVGTVRDEPRERGHPIETCLAVLRQQADCVPIELEGLTRGEVGEWLAQVSGRPVPVDLTSELYARTEGVPFFVREAIHLLDERGSLKHPERIPRHGITLPPRAVDLVRRAIDGVSSECAAFLEAAAVLGRDFVLTQVAAVAECDRLDALDWIDEAVHSGVVEEADDAVATYRFTHALFQEAIYDHMKPGRRARLHRRAAERLEAQHGDALEPVITELAHHHHHSIVVGDPDRAFELAWWAARHAEKVYAYEQAAIHYEQAYAALDHCEVVAPQKRLDTLLALGNAHRLSGEPEKRIRAFADAGAIAKTMNDPEALAEAAIGLCDLGEWAHTSPQTPGLVREAVTGLPPEALTHRARLTTRLAYLDVTRPDKAEPIAREGLALSRESGDSEAIQEALYMLHYVLAGPDHLAERSQIIVELSAAARSAENRDTAVIALLDIACDCIMQGDLIRATQMRRHADEIAGPRPSPSMTWHTRVWDTGLALLQGRYETVEPMARNALLLGQRLRHPYARACFNAQIALRDRDQGDHAAIVERLRGGLHARASATHWAKATLGRAYFASGDREHAEALFADLVESGSSRFARNIRFTGTIVEAAHLCADLEATDHAKGLIAELETVRDQHGMLPVPINYGGPVTFCMARLWESLGIADEALLAYREALAAARGLRALPTVAGIELAMAPLLQRMGERAEARAALERSASTAAGLGLSRLEAKAREALARA